MKPKYFNRSYLISQATANAVDEACELLDNPSKSYAVRECIKEGLAVIKKRVTSRNGKNLQQEQAVEDQFTPENPESQTGQEF